MTKEIDIDNICFVIMGFGSKTNYKTGKVLDLDITYNTIIKPAVLLAGMECLRADEILLPGSIDKKMYSLLFHAKLVIADISTLNPNAIYELGIRHAMKPHSTIIIQDNDPDMESIPFDLAHTTVVAYNHLGDNISEQETSRFKNKLNQLICNTQASIIDDSPIYTYLNKLVPPKLTDTEKEKLSKDIKTLVMSSKKTLYNLVGQAKDYMKEKKWESAFRTWEEASNTLSNEVYYKQQQALCLYKSNTKDKVTLIKALDIILLLDKGQKSHDTETLGIGGAIAKNLYHLDDDNNFYLDVANEFYRRGYNIGYDYYNGENHALCLNKLAKFENTEKGENFRMVDAERVRENIIRQLEIDICNCNGDKWKYATLANCHYALKNEEMYIKYKNKFKSQNPDSWELDTFNNGILDLKKLLDLNIKI